MTAFALHLRRSLLRFVAPVLAIAGGALVWSTAHPQVATQADIANGVGSTIAVLAPVLAGFAAWDALRERRHGGGPILDVAARPASRDLLARLGVAECAAAFVFTTVVVVAYVRVSGLGLAGTPMWANLLVPLLVLGLSAAIGILAAGTMRHWSAVIVAALPPAAVYAGALLMRGAGLAQSLNPFGNRAGGDFLDSNPPFFLGQALFLAGLLVLVVGLVLFGSRQDRWRGMVVSICAVGVAVSGAWTVDAQHQRWGIPVTDAANRLVEASSEDGGLVLAILPQYQAVQDELLTRWIRAQDLLSETPAAFERLEQLTDSHPEQAESAEPLRALYLNPASPTVATDSVLESLIDLHSPSCAQSRTFETTLVELWIAGTGAERRAQLMPEHADALARLRALDDHAARDWLANRFDRFVSCQISLDDFPPAS
ncbi:MAG: hypothetical protein ACTINZ_12150 [Microbacterium gubbeenense]|uniref:hypothetical protein n=1 Tax=Microbacterium gubbeenense TaxID=159896 RepID=UPI003F9AAD53